MKAAALKVPKHFAGIFPLLKSFYNKEAGYGSHANLIIGELNWVNPNEVLWLYTTKREEGYDGSQTQFGVNEDGKVIWGYFSHCSCYGYEDFGGRAEDLKLFEESELRKQHTYEMEEVPDNILPIIQKRLDAIIKDSRLKNY